MSVSDRSDSAARTSGSPSSSVPQFGFQNSYARLPERFGARVSPTPVAGPRLIKLNVRLAEDLGLDPLALASPAGVAILAGNSVAEGSEPLAMAYAGHQFGHFVPQLGDGRANLLGEVRGRDGCRYDIQLKGSGRTPFSRGGDGRAALGPVLREYLLSEAMAALGVPSTRALAAVSSGEVVRRERLLPGAVLTRVAASHLRVGSFQYFAAREDAEGVRLLADYAIGRHYPEAAGAPQPYRALLEGVVRRQADLVAQWLGLGFIHGVMNTDNTSISGETMDYGPCAFMESYDPGQVFSSIDAQGRYAYANQPNAMLWNLTRLAEALLPVLREEAGGEEAGLNAARQALATFEPRFHEARLATMQRKLGLEDLQAGDPALIDDLLERMAANDVDFTLFFRSLSDAAADETAEKQVRMLFSAPESFDQWAVGWRKRIREQPIDAHTLRDAMRRTNPAIIPRNHRVEEVIQAAVERSDLLPFETLLAAVTQPFASGTGWEHLALPARPEERVLATFCGT